MVKSNQLTLQQKNSMVSVGFVVSVQHFSSSNVCTSQHFFSSVLCVFRIFSCKYLTISYFQNIQTNYTEHRLLQRVFCLWTQYICSRYVEWVVNMDLVPVDQSLISWFWLVRLFCTRFHSTNTEVLMLVCFAPNAACFSVDIVLYSSFHNKIWQ